MNKLCIFVGMTVMSYAGWFLAAAVGIGFFGCFIVSGIASIIGVWMGWKFAQRYE